MRKEADVLRRCRLNMKRKSTKKRMTDAEHYDKHGVVSSIVEEEVAINLDAVLKQDIISGKRKRKSDLFNVPE